MRIDVKPFDDVRVRQAFRLIVDRQQMIDQAYSGLGAVANDMYARFDAGTPDLPQREQDIEQAKSLLKEAGYDGDLTVELVTSEGALGGDEVAAAQVFAEQAKAAGVTVKLKKVDAGVFYGEDYLTWPFAQDFWATRSFLAQASQGTMPDAPYNETHWENAEWLSLVQQAFKTVDDAERNALIAQAQEIEYNEGGYIVWSWRNQIDAYSRRSRPQAGQARRPDRPHVLQGRLLRLRQDPDLGQAAGACPFTSRPPPALLDTVGLRG